MANEPKEMSVPAKAAFDVLSASIEPLTLGEISEKAGIEIKAGNLTGLVRAGKVISIPMEYVCPECGHKKTYHVYKIAD